MAKHETFIMVSLEEEKAKKLAEVISNNTSRKILDHLAKKEASESELAKELSLPISTVHYNIQLLLKTNLVQSKEFTWSDKGKEINIYTLSKKYIIIAPSGTKVKESFNISSSCRKCINKDSNGHKYNSKLCFMVFTW